MWEIRPVKSCHKMPSMLESGSNLLIKLTISDKLRMGSQTNFDTKDNFLSPFVRISTPVCGVPASKFLTCSTIISKLPEKLSVHIKIGW